MSETLGLKNINMMSKERYDGIEEPATDELYAVATETYSDGDGNWYRIYPDGWCEQGGFSGTKGETTITLLKPYLSKNYTITLGLISAYTGSGQTLSNTGIKTKTNTGFTLTSDVNTSKDWRTCGYIAE